MNMFMHLHEKRERGSLKIDGDEQERALIIDKFTSVAYFLDGPVPYKSITVKIMHMQKFLIFISV